VAGVLFLVALVAEIVAAIGAPINQDDSAAKIAGALYDHRKRLLVIACLSVVYAAMFESGAARIRSGRERGSSATVLARGHAAGSAGQATA
jgi:hypothetical protein